MTSRSWEILKKIETDLREKFDNEIPKSHIERIIMREAGIDERTILKYLKTMVKMGIIQHTQRANIFRLCNGEPDDDMEHRTLTGEERAILGAEDEGGPGADTKPGDSGDRVQAPGIKKTAKKTNRHGKKSEE